MTSPVAAASPALAMTIGTVLVARFAAAGPGHTVSDDDFHVAANELFGESGKAAVLSVRPAEFDRDVLALDVPLLAQAGPERLQVAAVSGRGLGTQKTDTVGTPLPERAAGEREDRPAAARTASARRFASMMPPLLKAGRLPPGTAL